jgi:AcrR family transcriptional regulator
VNILCYYILKGDDSVPKDTFYNLSEAKKRRIFDAAVQEFSTRRFSEASINQIVKAAGIPRGSFYQYFSDKEDIFRYMFEEIVREKREIILRADVLDPDADVFDICIQTTKASLEWGRSKPEYSQISMLMEIDTSEFITKLRADSFEGLIKRIERDKECGLIRPEIDADLVADMMYTLIWKQFSLFGFNKSLFLKKINDGFKIIKAGITGV